jgi:hypothetical protein
MPYPIHASREVTPSSDRESPSDVAALCAQGGIKGGNKRRRQRPSGTVITNSHDNNCDREAGSSDMGHVSPTVSSNWPLVRPSIDLFKRLLGRPAQTMHTPSGTSSRTAT